MSNLREQMLAGQPLDLPVIDMHGHLGTWSFPIPATSGQSLVRAMDRCGVNTTVCSHMQSMAGYTVHGNREVFGAVREFPERIMGYVTLFPESAAVVERDTAEWLGNGFIGIKLHNSNGFPYTAPAYEPALARAHEHRLPVLLHTWGRHDEFEQIHTLAAKYDKAFFLAAHAGCGSLSGYIHLTMEHPNVLLETCLSSADRGLIKKLVTQAGARNVVFGSDALFLNQAQQLGRIVGADISDADKALVLGGNAHRILGERKV